MYQAMELLDRYKEQANAKQQRNWKMNLNQTEIETVVWWGSGRKGNTVPKAYNMDT